ncbi:MAG: hypothetical protein IE937_10745 [Gammaproteobacteria bacterium]|nr:hypothetical protein [Gammaproteobacteria bacterium]
MNNEKYLLEDEYGSYHIFDHDKNVKEFIAERLDRSDAEADDFRVWKISGELKVSARKEVTVNLID